MANWFSNMVKEIAQDKSRLANCRICKANNSFYETKFWKISISEDQTYLGRCYVALKRHCGDLKDLTDEEIIDFRDLVNKLETAIRKSFNATMFNWTCLMNNAYQEKNPEPHVHWHMRPRYELKITFENEVFEDVEFGQHYLREGKHNVSEDLRNKIAEEIKKNLS